MDKKDITNVAVDAVISLFALGGSFLLNILPEINSKAFIISVAQISSLIVFLFIKFLLLNKQTANILVRITIITSIIFLGTSMYYYNFQEKYSKSIPHKNEKLVRGIVSDDIMALCEKSSVTKIKCEDWYISVATVDKLPETWTTDSVSWNTNIFICLYILIVLSLSFTVFTLVEIINGKT